MAGNVISRARKAYTLADYPSGQRGLTVNQLALPSQVRILYLPPIEILEPTVRPWVLVFLIVGMSISNSFQYATVPLNVRKQLIGLVLKILTWQIMSEASYCHGCNYAIVGVT